jgi:hypothetical protein
MRRDGLIEAALLTLAGEWRSIGAPSSVVGLSGMVR